MDRFEHALAPVLEIGREVRAKHSVQVILQ